MTRESIANLKQALVYSLKVWLTSAIVVPFVWAIGYNLMYFDAGNLMTIPFGWIFLTLATILVSSVVWLIFFFTAWIVFRHYADDKYLRLKLLVIGEFLTVVPFVLFTYILPGYDKVVYFLIMSLHCIVIGVSIYYYRIQPTLTIEVPFKETR